jgi:DinB family protein
VRDELQAVVDEYVQARARLHDLANQVTESVWTRRPSPDRWSIAECVAHLNLTAEALLPLIDDALDRARRLDRAPLRRLRRDPPGWLLWKAMGPPVRVRTKTAAAFVPSSGLTKSELVASFDRLQSEQVRRIRDSDALPIDRVAVRSPFNARVKYNLYAALSILARHQHRHLWQAEQARVLIGGLT